MENTSLKEQTYLIFKRKEIEFEIPDEFPEDQIPKFSSLKDFENWFKKQDFSQYQVKEEEDKTSYLLSLNKFDTFVDYNENNLAEFQYGANLALELIDDIKNNHHLFKGESLPEKLLSVFPENHIRILSKIMLPLEVYEKIKCMFERKLTDIAFSDSIGEYISIDEISEQFTQFLYNEKVDLSSENFYNSDFSYFSSFEEQEDWSEWDNPPFTKIKTELLLKMCRKDLPQEQFNSVKEKFNKLIETNQFEKLKVILLHGSLPKPFLKLLIEGNPNLSPKYYSLIFNAMK